MKPEGIIKERKRVKAAIGEAKAKLEEAIDSDLWSYIMEYQLGKLDIAKKILEEVVGDIEPSLPDSVGPIAPVTPTQIIEAVASFYKITTPVLTGQDRDKQWALARHVAMYLIRQETNLTLAQIGKEIGGRNLTTVHFAYARIAGQLPDDEALRMAIRSIQKKILERVSI